MKTLISFLVIFLSFITPIKPLVLLVVGMVILDTITGVYAVLKLKGRKSFRSGVLFNIVPKTLLYSATILLSFFIDTFIFGSLLFGIQHLLSKSCSLLWVYVEVKSIDENSQKLGNRPFFDIVKEFFRKMKNIKKDINDVCH
jgi:hypothetical protein